uniref:Uncharacterized protein n=1 Tax=Candidatus Kentrum sp. MB TaxID=2138164 RepID=A0A450X389_9GAMM|nr:MAG: hypothetical protein BECKMB1821G_GA0114241_100616 [Candidatus Kentron sp. MB]VFK26685.1 MAG: hypothetical protein BECKMB1821I_GA0114274_100189 [Candidatus Kentron sp. MB]VFK74597.1 MAG: hypothetical protein BECKMB1821H_GA0114242_100716 [Candidatus Kentron sp. MB]
MAGFLSQQDIRLFDYAKWVEPLRDEPRENADRIAVDTDPDIAFIRKSGSFRK